MNRAINRDINAVLLPRSIGHHAWLPSRLSWIFYLHGRERLSICFWHHVIFAQNSKSIFLLCSMLPPGSICVLLFVISWRYRLTASARTVVGLSQLPARRRGTHCQHTFVVWRTAPLHLDDYLRLICFLSTSVYSALGVSAIMRYINRRFTYLLTYLLTYRLWWTGLEM